MSIDTMGSSVYPKIPFKLVSDANLKAWLISAVVLGIGE
jgi:hypothetical protein